MRRLQAIAVACLAPAMAAQAQEAGWHYSPLAGEGDRAALGCARGSDAAHFTCVAVRCEDDFTTGVHIYTDSADNSGGWRITVDEEFFDVVAVLDESPYRTRIEGDVAPVLDALKNGAVAYLTPANGPELGLNAIPLSGSLYAINQALYFCAPKAGEEEPVSAPQ